MMTHAAGGIVAEAERADGEATLVSGGNLACAACAGQEAGPTHACSVH